MKSTSKRRSPASRRSGGVTARRSFAPPTVVPSDAKAVKKQVLALMRRASALLYTHFVWPVQELDSKACSPWAASAGLLGTLLNGLYSNDRPEARYELMAAIEEAATNIRRENASIARREIAAATNAAKGLTP